MPIPVSRTAKTTVRLVRGADTRSDDLAWLGELERVGQQVLQDLPEPLRIGLDPLGRSGLHGRR